VKFASVAVDGKDEKEKILAEEFGAFGPSLFLEVKKDGKTETSPSTRCGHDRQGRPRLPRPGGRIDQETALMNWGDWPPYAAVSLGLMTAISPCPWPPTSPPWPS